MSSLSFLWKLTTRTFMVLCSSLLLWASIRTFQHYVLGYPNHTSSPFDAAAWLVQRKLKPELCRKISPNFMFGSQPAEQKAECIYQYAKLTKDPSACELLMPSSYGLYCVGAAEDFDPCIMLADDKKTVKGQGLETTYDSCQNGVKAQHVCCSMARVLYSDERNCGNFPQGELRDQCHHIVGVREKKIEECALIENERNRTGCEVVVRAYLTGRL